MWSALIDARVSRRRRLSDDGLRDWSPHHRKRVYRASHTCAIAKGSCGRHFTGAATASTIAHHSSTDGISLLRHFPIGPEGNKADESYLEPLILPAQTDRGCATDGIRPTHVPVVDTTRLTVPETGKQVLLDAMYVRRPRVLKDHWQHDWCRSWRGYAGRGGIMRDSL